MFHIFTLSNICSNCILNVQNIRKNKLNIQFNQYNFFNFCKESDDFELCNLSLNSFYNIVLNNISSKEICVLNGKCPKDILFVNNSCQNCLKYVQKVSKKSFLNLFITSNITIPYKKIKSFIQKGYSNNLICEKEGYCKKNSIYPIPLGITSQNCSICIGFMKYIFQQKRKPFSQFLLSQIWENICQNINLGELTCNQPKLNNNEKLSLFLEYMETKYNEQSLCLMSKLCP